MTAPHKTIGTLGEELARIEAYLNRRERGVPEPLSDAFVARLMVTFIERADDLRPVLRRVLGRDLS